MASRTLLDKLFPGENPAPIATLVEGSGRNCRPEDVYECPLRRATKSLQVSPVSLFYVLPTRLPLLFAEEIKWLTFTKVLHFPFSLESPGSKCFGIQSLQYPL